MPPGNHAPPMTSSSSGIQERRKSLRVGAPRLRINLLRPQGVVAVDNVNFSEGGVCIRVEETLEVRAIIRLQLTPERLSPARSLRAFECMGRVAWVIQRLDLRALPPFLYDVGIEFVDPPSALQHVIAQKGSRLLSTKERSSEGKILESAVVHGRRFVPRLDRESNHPSRWHLIVSVDGVPCFSSRYASERLALSAWEQFKRQQAKR